METLTEESLINSLQKSWEKLVERIVPGNVVDSLISESILTPYEYDCVTAELVRQDKVRKILYFVQRKEAEKFQTFLKILREKDDYRLEAETIVMRACLYQCEEEIIQQENNDNKRNNENMEKNENMIKTFANLGRFHQWQCIRLTRQGKLKARLRFLIDEFAPEKRKHFFIFLETLKSLQLTALEARLFQLCDLDEYDAVDDKKVKNTSLIQTTTTIVTSVRDESPQPHYVKKIINLYFMRDQFDQAFDDLNRAIEHQRGPHKYIRKVYRREHNITIVRDKYDSRNSLQHLFDQFDSTRESFDDDVVIEWITVIAEALAHLHMLNSCHGNLKPSNIFRNGNSIEFVDFAIKTAFLNYFDARAKSSKHRLKYVSPEAKERKRIVTRSDIWSLGAIVYDMLVRDEDIQNRDLSLIQSGLLRNLLERMLQYEPDDRPTAVEVGEFLLQMDAKPAEPQPSAFPVQSIRDVAATVRVNEQRIRRISFQNIEYPRPMSVEKRISEITRPFQSNTRYKSDRWKALHFVCLTACDDDEVFRHLKTDVNAKTRHNETPLHVACKQGHINVVHFLLLHGANVWLKTNKGMTALHFAAAGGFDDIVVVLLNKTGAVIDERNNDKETALHLAAGQGHVEVVKVLVERRAKFELRTQKRETALHFAARSGHSEVCEILLLENADPENKNQSGYTALYLACVNGCHEVVKVIAKYADINEKIFKGKTPLHLAAEHNHEAVVKCLINPSLKANVNVQDRTGKTPLHVACEKGYTSIVNLLLSKCPDLSLRDDYHMTASELAKKLEIRHVISKHRGRKM